MVPLFWIICIPFQAIQCFFTQSVNKFTDNVLYIAHATEAQEGVCTAICAGNMKMLPVAYVSGFIASHLLCNGTCDACKACLMSEPPSPTDAFVSFKECSGTVVSYLSEKLVETVGTAVTVIEGMISEVAHSDMVESCITGGIKESVNFDWVFSSPPKN